MDNSPTPTVAVGDLSSLEANRDPQFDEKPIGNETGKEVTTLDPSEDPKHRPMLQRWIMTIIICISSTCVTFNSSVGAATQQGLVKDFHVSEEVTILSISLFVVGLGLGPLLLGPLSEFYGRWKVYVYSYIALFALTWGVAFSPNIAAHLILRFLSGFSGAAFLSVAGGSVGDLFSNHEIAYPMVIYTMSPFLGPITGPIIAGFINEHVTWRWTYWVALIWEFFQLLGLAFFVPETYEPVLLQRKAACLRKETGDPSYYAALDKHDAGLAHAILVSCYKPFQILFYEPMALLLGLWSSLLLGILYLAFEGFPIIFGQNHGFSLEFIGLSFIGLGIGMIFVPCVQPFWNNIYRKEAEKYKGNPPPETRLIVGFAGAILSPISLIWLAFTSYSHVHWIVPVIASIPFGAGIIFSFSAVLTYLVVAYRRYAASAMAGNSFLRSSFAAGFPLFAAAMFKKLTPTGAVGLLAGLLVIMMPFPFLFYRYGERIRRRSRFATF